MNITKVKTPRKPQESIIAAPDTSNPALQCYTAAVHVYERQSDLLDTMSAVLVDASPMADRARHV